MHTAVSSIVKGALTLQLDGLKSAMRQMAREKDTATEEARAPLQKQLQVTRLLNWMPFPIYDLFQSQG